MISINIACEGANTINIHNLKPFQGNLKDLTKANYEKLKTQIIDLGFSEPVSVWKHKGENYILNGHQRLRALQQMEKEGYFIPEIPFNYIEAKSVKEAKKKVLSLTSQFGKMTDEGLYEFVTEAEIQPEELGDFVFSDVPIDLFIESHYEAEPEKTSGGKSEDDAIPETSENSRGVSLGDLYRLGDHTLLCGDCCDLSLVNKYESLSKGDWPLEMVEMVYADPPYGIDEETERDRAYRSKSCKAGSYKKIVGDKTTDTAIKAFEIYAKENVSQIWWGANYYANKLPNNACWVVWDKRCDEKLNDARSDGEMAWIKYGEKASLRIFRHAWKGMIKDSEHGQSRVHPTQKPVALAEWCFENYGKPNIVLDPFLGSGASLIAAENLGIKCLGIEIDPHYCSVVIERWENHTGKKAEKIGGLV